jgi:hypothetical protein
VPVSGKQKAKYTKGPQRQCGSVLRENRRREDIYLSTLFISYAMPFFKFL